MGSPVESASFHRMSPSECPALDRRPLAQNLPSMETDTVVVGTRPQSPPIFSAVDMRQGMGPLP